MQRSCGIFLHPTSLPGAFGIGDLGSEAYKWIELLAHSNMGYWQLCPLGPTGYGDSPYQCLSSFAGNTLLISPEKLCEDGLLDKADLAAAEAPAGRRVDFGAVIKSKEALFRKAYIRFTATEEFERFCEEQRSWLDDYALFLVIKNRHGGAAWNQWDSPFKLRYPAVLDQIRDAERKDVRYYKFLQFIFNRQWMQLKQHAGERGVRIIGDMPYYAAYDSSDAWAMPDLFELDEAGNPLRLAGVPPDYFSETGQLWGNPLYQWETIRADGYAWWISRIRNILDLVDVIRLDHFRAFESYWAIPAGSAVAAEGKWEKGPGMDFFNALRRELGNDLPLMAEDLGEITHGVEELRRAVNIPGMKVLQFAFDGKPDNPYLPYNLTADSVIYTGTHDNDTSRGWFAALTPAEQNRICKFVDCTPATFVAQFIRTAFMSASRNCIVPLADVLGLGSAARMNTPGKQDGNWQWRFTADMLTPEKLTMMAEYAEIYGRAPVAESMPS
ncbi:MAG: 4-alpha-glucanotransferase [Chitinivibrionales bacterium]|nr:4-alpha-glucanotransferase [Chitinivibrionales bacterium]